MHGSAVLPLATVKKTCSGFGEIFELSKGKSFTILISAVDRK